MFFADRCVGALFVMLALCLELFVDAWLFVNSFRYRRLGGKNEVNPTGQSFRFVRACERAGEAKLRGQARAVMPSSLGHGSGQMFPSAPSSGAPRVVPCPAGCPVGCPVVVPWLSRGAPRVVPWLSRGCPAVPSGLIDRQINGSIDR